MQKVSVIIPVYNTEKYLSSCLDSVLNQSLQDIELICINDGSTDSSPHILKHYAEFDSRIKVITIENSGLSVVRNIGIEEASAKYIFFLDSDDFIVQPALEYLFNSAEKHKSDFTFCDIWAFDDKTKQKIPFWDFLPLSFTNKYKNRSFNHKKLPNSIYFQIPAVAWNKLYRRDFLINNSIKFERGMIFEDHPFFAQIYLNAESISYVNEKLVYYRVNRTDSLTKLAGEKHLDCIKSLDLTDKVFKSCGEFEKYKTDLLNLKINLLFTRLEQINPEFHNEFCLRIRNLYSNLDFNGYNIDKLRKNSNFGLFLKIIGRCL